MNIKVDYKLKNALDFNAKEYLADMLANSYYNKRKKGLLCLIGLVIGLHYTKITN